MNKCSYENVNKTSMKKKEITTMKKSYKIEVDCANCANKMEEAAKNTAGVKDASVNFMMLKMKVEFEEGQDPDSVIDLRYVFSLRKKNNILKKSIVPVSIL